MIAACDCPRCDFARLLAQAQREGRLVTTRSAFDRKEPPPVEVFVHPREVVASQRTNAVYLIQTYPTLPVACTGRTEATNAF